MKIDLKKITDLRNDKILEENLSDLGICFFNRTKKQTKSTSEKRKNDKISFTKLKRSFVKNCERTEISSNLQTNQLASLSSTGVVTQES